MRGGIVDLTVDAHMLENVLDAVVLGLDEDEVHVRVRLDREAAVRVVEDAGEVGAKLAEGVADHLVGDLMREREEQEIM